MTDSERVNAAGNRRRADSACATEQNLFTAKSKY